MLDTRGSRQWYCKQEVSRIPHLKEPLHTSAHVFRNKEFGGFLLQPTGARLLTLRGLVLEA